MKEQNQTLSNAAETYHKKFGWCIIPLKPKDKKPLITWEPFQKKRSTLEEIKKWWKETPDANIGLVTGKISGGIYVIDADTKEGIEFAKEAGLPPTPTAKTAHGFHYYFKYEGERELRNFAKIKNLDFRGDGGYVLLPPSIHPDGPVYSWVEPLNPATTDIAEMPEWVEKLTMEVSPRPVIKRGKGAGASEVQKIKKGVPKGSRHNDGVRLAGHYFNRRLNLAEVKDLLLAWNRGNDPPMDYKEVVSIVESLAKTREKERGDDKRTRGGAPISRTLVPNLVHLLPQQIGQGDPELWYLLLMDGRLKKLPSLTSGSQETFPKQDLAYLYPSEKVFDYFKNPHNSNLLSMVRSYIAAHIELPNPSDDLILTCWILHTYLIEKFDTTPIINFCGVSETGKSRAVEVLYKIAYRGEWKTTPTEATLFREATFFQTTLFLDEFKVFGPDGNPAAAQLVRSRYKRGIKVSRINQNRVGEDQVEYFDVFGPTAISSIETLPVPLESRSLIFLMRKNISKDVERKIDEAQAQDLRDRLTAWRAKNLLVGLPNLESPLRRRLREITEPLILSAELGGANPGQLEELYEAFEKLSNVRESAESYGFEAEIVQGIYDAWLKGGVEGRKFAIKTVTKIINQRREEKEELKTRTVGSVIYKLGFIRDRVGLTGDKGFRYSPVLLKQLMKRYGIEGEENLGG